MGGFTQIPNSVLQDSTLSTGARLTAILLKSYAFDKDVCFPNQSTLARQIGCNVRTIHRYLDELLKRGLISKMRRRSGFGNVYRLSTKLLITTPSVNDTSVPSSGHDDPANAGQTSPSNNTHREDKHAIGMLNRDTNNQRDQTSLSDSIGSDVRSGSTYDHENMKRTNLSPPRPTPDVRVQPPWPPPYKTALETAASKNPSSGTSPQKFRRPNGNQYED